MMVSLVFTTCILFDSNRDKLLLSGVRCLLDEAGSSALPSPVRFSYSAVTNSLSYLDLWEQQGLDFLFPERIRKWVNILLEQGAKWSSKQPRSRIGEVWRQVFLLWRYILLLHPAGGREAKILGEHIFSIFPWGDCSMHRPVVSESPLILPSISCLNFADFGTCLEGGGTPTFYAAT